MTDTAEMFQHTDMSDAAYTEDIDAAGIYLQAVKEFKPYYERFVGYPVEDSLFHQEAGELFLAAYRQQPVWSHPLAKTALVGAGSLAATLVVGFALSHSADNQPVAEQSLPPAAPPTQPAYREQTSKTSPAPQIASPSLARVEFSNLQAAQPPAIDQPDVAVSPPIKMPLQFPVVQLAGQLEAIAQPETAQLAPQPDAIALERATTAQPQSGNEISTPLAVTAAVSPDSLQLSDRPAPDRSGDGAIAPPQPISIGNTPLRTISNTGTSSEATSTPVEVSTPSETLGTLPSQLTPALPAWVDSNLAPLETSSPSENVLPLSGAEARPNEQTAPSVKPHPLADLDSARTQTRSVWEVSSSIAFRSIAPRNHGVSEPEASTARSVAIEGVQVISAHPSIRKSIAVKPDRPVLAR